MWDIGIDKYDTFVLKILKLLGQKHKIIMTPHTRVLEKIANLDEKSNDFIRECLIELSENF